MVTEVGVLALVCLQESFLCVDYITLKSFLLILVDRRLMERVNHVAPLLLTCLKRTIVV